MVKAIEEQDKKVQAQSDAMVNAIEENTNQIDSRKEEDKFKKASSQVDVLMHNADNKMDFKGVLRSRNLRIVYFLTMMESRKQIWFLVKISIPVACFQNLTKQLCL